MHIPRPSPPHLLRRPRRPEQLNESARQLKSACPRRRGLLPDGPLHINANAQRAADRKAVQAGLADAARKSQIQRLAIIRQVQWRVVVVVQRQLVPLHWCISAARHSTTHTHTERDEYAYVRRKKREGSSGCALPAMAIAIPSTCAGRSLPWSCSDGVVPAVTTSTCRTYDFKRCNRRADERQLRISIVAQDFWPDYTDAWSRRLNPSPRLPIPRSARQTVSSGPRALA